MNVCWPLDLFPLALRHVAQGGGVGGLPGPRRRSTLPQDFWHNLHGPAEGMGAVEVRLRGSKETDGGRDLGGPLIAQAQQSTDAWHMGGHPKGSKSLGW